MSKATLNGLPLLMSPDVSWAFTSGVQAYQTVFRVSKENADLLAKVTGDVTLVMAPDDRPRLEVKKLSILGIEPTDSPYFRLVRVSDLRWKWNRKHVVRHYNVPRTISDFRRLKQEGVPVQAQKLAQGVSCALWSLAPRESPSSPWTAIGVIEDVLQAVTDGKDYQFRELLSSYRATVLDMKLEDAGDAAISRALALIPGANVFVNADGTVIVFNELDQSEGALLSKGPVYQGPSLAAKLDFSRTRPSSVNVLFDREIEVRFDSTTEGGTVSADARALENVAPLPDVSLLVNGTTKATGTWLTFDDLFASWPTPGAAPKLSHSVVQDFWMTALMLQMYAIPVGTHVIDQAWARRIQAVKKHYRQTYRITKRWMDRLKAVRANRVAIIDPEHGTRAAAQVFADHALDFLKQGLCRTSADGEAFSIENVYGYAALLKDANASAPAIVSLEDEDQGIVRLDYEGDGFSYDVIPSAVVGADGKATSLPSYDLRKAQKGKGEGFLTEYVNLAPGHRVAIVLTVEPGAPNDERLCHSENVLPKEASDKLGISVGDCNGPAWTIRVGAQILTAKFEWQDANASKIEQACGVGGQAPKNGQGFTLLGKPSNFDTLRSVAVAAATALYGSLIDRVEGRHEVTFKPDVVPTGYASIVEHRMPAHHTPETIVTFPTIVHGVDIFSLLPESVRQEVLRVPQH